MRFEIEEAAGKSRFLGAAFVCALSARQKRRAAAVGWAWKNRGLSL
jgi:hypothetical protein